MDKYERKILEYFIKKYEASKSFAGTNKVNQKFQVKVVKLFPQYGDDADYDTFIRMNEAVAQLERIGFITATYQGNNSVVDTIRLCVDTVEKIYSYVGIIPRKEQQKNLRSILEPYSKYKNELGTYAIAQLKRLDENKQVEYFTSDMSELKRILKVCEFLIDNKVETYKREVSVRILGDSKELEAMQGKVQGLLYQYGNYEEKEFVLEECGVVNTPTYVIVKGKGRLCFEKQMIDLDLLGSDLSMSTNTIQLLSSIEVMGSKVITIENLTTFHDYKVEDEFIMYLGGFHNQVKNQLLKLLYAQNKDKQYMHFGDIDAGGFYIYNHLIRKTQIPFTLYKMDIRVLEEHKAYWKSLSDNDYKRLKRLLMDQDNRIVGEDYSEVIKYMIENNCKLEQEAIL
ncbi:MAG: DUF2220 family protein [Eubacteriales bacterium]